MFRCFNCIDMRKAESTITCPQCKKQGMEIYVDKAAGEGILNILATTERILNILKDREMKSELKKSIKSLECQNCGNKESKFDYTVVERIHED